MFWWDRACYPRQSDVCRSVIKVDSTIKMTQLSKWRNQLLSGGNLSVKNRMHLHLDQRCCYEHNPDLCVYDDVTDQNIPRDHDTSHPCTELWFARCIIDYTYLKRLQTSCFYYLYYKTKLLSLLALCNICPPVILHLNIPTCWQVWLETTQQQV